MWFIILTWLVHFAVCERNYSLISQIIALDNKGTSTCFFFLLRLGVLIYICLLIVIRVCPSVFVDVISCCGDNYLVLARSAVWYCLRFFSFLLGFRQ